MAIEKRWMQVGPLVLIANGDTEGTVIVPSTANLYVKQAVILQSSSVEFTNLEIKAVLSKTALKVGKRGPGMSTFEDISSLLVADGATIRADQQPRPSIEQKEHERAVFAEEPIVAKRVIGVDPIGDYYTPTNPFPVEMAQRPTIPFVKNIIIDNKDSLQELELPANTRQLMVKLKRGALSLAFTADATEFITASLGAFYYIEAINYTGSIFFKSSKDSDVIEIHAWS